MKAIILVLLNSKHRVILYEDMLSCADGEHVFYLRDHI